MALSLYLSDEFTAHRPQPYKVSVPAATSVPVTLGGDFSVDFGARDPVSNLVAVKNHWDGIGAPPSVLFSWTPPPATAMNSDYQGILLYAARSNVSYPLLPPDGTGDLGTIHSGPNTAYLAPGLDYIPLNDAFNYVPKTSNPYNIFDDLHADAAYVIAPDIPYFTFLAFALYGSSPAVSDIYAEARHGASCTLNELL